MDRAFSRIEIKSVDSERRELTGIASTPEVDRQGDVIESTGLTYANPVPLLLGHKADQPVGNVWFDPPTRTGIAFRAVIHREEEPGTLRERTNEAWQSVRARILRAVSVGFLPIEAKAMENGGVRFLKAQLLELSLVAIPANQSATITNIKFYDQPRSRPMATPAKPYASRLSSQLLMQPIEHMTDSQFLSHSKAILSAFANEDDG